MKSLFRTRRARACTSFIAAAVLALVVGWPSAADASHDNPFGGGAGLYLGLVFGDTAGISYGLELYTNAYFGHDGVCSEGENPIAGTFAQLGGINGEAVQIVVGGHAGADTEQQYGVVGELGAVVHLRRERSPEWGLHTGALFQTPLYMTVFMRQGWVIDAYSFGAGARIPPTFGPYDCQVDY